MFADDTDPDQGLMFDGRVAEDFKLTTGTWVSVSTIRGALVSAARVLTDAVIAGHDRAEVTALAWLHPTEARKLCGIESDAELPIDHPVLRAHLAAILTALAAGNGSAGRVARLLLCADPPDLDAGEITDKGYINQRVVLDRRSDLVERLYRPTPDPEIIGPVQATDQPAERTVTSHSSANASSRRWTARPT